MDCDQATLRLNSAHPLWNYREALESPAFTVCAGGQYSTVPGVRYVRKAEWLPRK